jgi:Protein of unknown function (DUF2948)
MFLKLIAMDAEDLAIMSAHLQDASVRASDMTYLPRERRFALVCTRPDHVSGEAARACGLHFERVLKVERLNAKPDALTLIGLGFEAGEAPSGQVTLLFEGGAAIRLTVECIEAVMRDLEPGTEAKAG